ncbi:MAG: penicillin-binding protein 1C [bacterium]|nr:penicillin-binding protein 1C [bacterium]
MKIKKTIKIFAGVFVLLGLLYIAVPLPRPLFENDYSTVVTDEEGNILRAFLNKGQQWHFPSQEDLKIPTKLKKAILHYEDRHFYRHPGINPVSLVRALFQNISSGKVKSGASTLSMQVIRLAFKRKRTFFNKWLEMHQALKLEITYSKEEIFKMYVDHAPYGGNIVGYYAASMKYFNRPPRRLTWSQAAVLAVLPNAPGLISPLVNREHLINKRNGLLKSLLEAEIIDAETYKSSLREPVPGAAQSFFRAAPHLARALKSKYSGFIHTTIHKKYQVAIEEMVKNHLKYLNTLGIRNGAVLVVETGTGKVRAYAGSQEFFAGDGGQVDGIVSPRSSGSILKPFLYALAMDEGHVLPSTVIRDVPSYFGSFSPSNADKKYNGLVTAKEALIRSLNVPAVRLLNAYGLYKFYIFLKAAGLSTLFRRPDEYGLTLVLGGAETTLYDLAVLYRGLGNYGKFGPLTLLSEKSSAGHPPHTDGAEQLLSPEACRLTLNVLKELRRPGSEYYWEQYRGQHPLAWKTGTSYGQRDAWAVGVNPSWTIAVWVGNFDGEGNSNISGAACAAPLMLDIFNFLPKSNEKNWFVQSGLDLKPVELCMDTGFLAGPDCERTYTADSPPVKKPLRRCPFHRGIYVTSDEKVQVCSLCWEPGKYKKVKRLVYPPDVTQYLREAGVIVSTVPPHRKGCAGAAEDNPLQVVYPVAGARLWVPRDFDGRLQQVTFSAAHRVPGRKVFWYLDNVYMGVTVGKHKMVFDLSTGDHILEVVDESGNRVRRQFSALRRPAARGGYLHSQGAPRHWGAAGLNIHPLTRYRTGITRGDMGCAAAVGTPATFAGPAHASIRLATAGNLLHFTRFQVGNCALVER